MFLKYKRSLRRKQTLWDKISSIKNQYKIEKPYKNTLALLKQITFEVDINRQQILCKNLIKNHTF